MLIDQLPKELSFVSEIVGRRRREQERLLTERLGPAAIARLDAMFDTRVDASIPAPRPTAVAVETTGQVPLLSDPVPSAKVKSPRGMKVCPDCLESVLRAARSCVYCRYEFELAVSAWPLPRTVAAA